MIDAYKQEAEARAAIYWWLSTVFATELEPKQLSAYFGAEGQAFLDGLARALPGDGEPGPVARLKNALATLAPMAQPQLELAADFAQAFLGDNRSSALPYASIYLSQEGLLFQQPHQEMLALLRAQGLAVTEQYREPADHLAIMLDYLGNQVLRLVEAATPEERKRLRQEQLAFIEERLLTWVPAFRQRCERVPGCGFYPAVATYLEAFLLAERDDLREQEG